MTIKEGEIMAFFDFGFQALEAILKAFGCISHGSGDHFRCDFGVWGLLGEVILGSGSTLRHQKVT